MKWQIRSIPNFDRRVKKLAKKHRSIKSDITELVKLLSEKPFAGTKITKDTYKIRMAIKSKGTGKSSGARIIYLPL